MNWHCEYTCKQNQENALGCVFDRYKGNSDKNTAWGVFKPLNKKKRKKKNHKHDKDYDKHWRNCAIGQSELQ